MIGGIGKGIGSAIKGLNVSGGGLGNIVEAMSKSGGGSNMMAALEKAFKAQPNGGGGGGGTATPQIDPKQIAQAFQKMAYIQALTEELELVKRSRMPARFHMAMFERRLRSIRERAAMMQKQRQMMDMLSQIVEKQNQSAKSIIQSLGR